MKYSRRIIGAVGVGVAAYGGFLLASDVPWADLFALGVWLALAVVVHDGVIVPLSMGVRRLVRHRGRALPAAAVRCIEIGAAVGGVLTLFVSAELWAQARGSVNPTILTGPYAFRLALVWLVIAAVVWIVVAILVRRDARGRISEGQPLEA